MNEQVDKLTKEIEALRKEMHLMRGLMKEHNVLLNEFMVRQQKAMKISSKRSLYTSSGFFPIASEESLKAIESYINDETLRNLVVEVKLLLPNGIIKGLQNILSLCIILEYNLDGIKGKKRFLAYPKFINLLYRAVCVEGMERHDFQEDLRKAFQMTKNRYFKAQHRRRLLQKEDEGS